MPLPALALLLASLAGAAPAPRISLERQIGQVLMATASPKDLESKKDWITRGRLGGLLLRVGRLKVEEVRRLTEQVQGWAAESGTPLLIAVDNEGGPQFTLRSMGLTVFPSAMALGATYSDMNAFLSSYFSAKELRSLGITMNFAPVLDVNTNPKNPIIGIRSYGEDAEQVSSQGAIAVEGALRGGVAPVAKHFPGHGSTLRDSHKELPVVLSSSATLEAVDLAPFKAAIAAGLPAIMSAHVSYPALDPSGLPATLSKPILTGLLRERWGFGGVVVTDSLDMRAITSRWTVPEAGIEALNAGADLLLIGDGPIEPVYQGIVEALSDGRLQVPVLRRASDRVRALKAKLASPEVGVPLEHEELARIRKTAAEIAERSVTVLEDKEGLLPLKPAKSPLLVLFMPPGYARETALLDYLFRKRYPGAEAVVLGAEPDGREADAAVAKAKKADLLVLGTFHWGRARYSRQVRAARRLLKSCPASVLVSLMNPFDQQYFQAGTRVATYGITAASAKALARVLFGEVPPQGLAPVQASGWKDPAPGEAE